MPRARRGAAAGSPPAPLPAGLENGVEADLPEREENARLGQRRELADEIVPAPIQLRRLGPVPGRGAAPGRGDEDAVERHPVVGAERIRPAGQTLAVELAVEPLAGSVAREHPAGSVGSVRPRGESNDDEPRLGVAEAGDGLSPVGLVPVRGALLARDGGAVGAEPRAALARDHVGGDGAKA